MTKRRHTRMSKEGDIFRETKTEENTETEWWRERKREKMECASRVRCPIPSPRLSKCFPGGLGLTVTRAFLFHQVTLLLLTAATKWRWTHLISPAKSLRLCTDIAHSHLHNFSLSHTYSASQRFGHTYSFKGYPLYTINRVWHTLMNDLWSLYVCYIKPL